MRQIIVIALESLAWYLGYLPYTYWLQLRLCLWSVALNDRWKLDVWGPPQP